MPSFARLLIGFAVLVFAPGAVADSVLRVGTSGDYPPFSRELGGETAGFVGFDIAVARDFSDAHSRTLVLQRFRWPALIRDLESDHFDVAMSGVTITPERSAAGRFSVPVVETGAVVLVRPKQPALDLDSLDHGELRIGVNAGGYLERVARARFPHAALVAIPDNAAVLNALVGDRVDAVVTDTLEAPGWMAAAGDVKLLGPLTRDRKAYLVRADQPELAARLDRWLLARERDGRLAALRRQYLGPNSGPPLAGPLLALLAAVDERLALMPLVAVAKQRGGAPLEAAAREAVVLAAAVAAVSAEALAIGARTPDADSVRALYRAQIDAAKQIQQATLEQPLEARPEGVFDLDTQLRPALLRIGEKVARLVVALPPGLAEDAVRAAAQAELRTPQLAEASRRDIASAIAALSQASKAQ